MEPARPTVDFATPEDVPLQFELAGPGSRILAGLLDQVLIVIIEAGMLMTALVVGIIAQKINEAQVEDWAEQMQTSGPTLTMLGISLVAAFVVNFGYYVLLEMTSNGQTVGKRLLGLRTIRDGGFPITLTSSLLRNLARLIDMFPNTYFVGVVTMVAHPKEKRLGDMLAGTVVVRERRRSDGGLPFGDQRYSSLAERRYHLDRAALRDLDEESEQVLVQFFSRSRLPRPQEARIVEALSDGLAARLPAAPGFETDRDRLLFLKEVYLALRERREMG